MAEFLNIRACVGFIPRWTGVMEEKLREFSREGIRAI